MNVKVIEVKENLLIENSKKADSLRKKLASKGIYFINVMASPGSGKTTLLVEIINKLKKDFSIGVLEADIDGDVDAERISRLTGVRSIQVHTSGACHLTAQMVEDAIDSFDMGDTNLLFLENVGNLVCPAEFDTGSNMNLVLLSVPEGDDKPLKYPLMFEVADMVVITKLDTLPAFNFDVDRCIKNIHLRNKDIPVFKASSLLKQGIDDIVDALKMKTAYK